MQSNDEDSELTKAPLISKSPILKYENVVYNLCQAWEY